MTQDGTQQPTAPMPTQTAAPSPGDEQSAAPATRQTRQQRRAAKKFMHPKTKRTLIIAASTLGVLTLAGVAWGAYFYTSIANKLAPADAQTAAEVVSVLDTRIVDSTVGVAPEYILLLGSDARPGQRRARSDSIVIARIEPDTQKVTLLSIPRDTRVPIPGRGMDKITHANAYGGPALAIKTVRAYTGLPINHYVELNFAGFADIVDALGGVTINVDKTINDRHGANTGGVSNVTYVPAGKHKLSGPAALTYVRARHGVVGGDLGRMKHQQTFLKALSTQVLASKNLGRLPKVIDAAADNITTDMKVSKIVSLSTEFRGFSGKSIKSYSATGRGGRVNGVSYVIPDRTRSEALFRAFEAGTPPKKQR